MERRGEKQGREEQRGEGGIEERSEEEKTAHFIFLVKQK